MLKRDGRVLGTNRKRLPSRNNQIHSLGLGDTAYTKLSILGDAVVWYSSIAGADVAGV